MSTMAGMATAIPPNTRNTMTIRQSKPMEASRLAALLQLSSPALPIGGYSYSQALESAVELKIITDEASACQWIGQQLSIVVAQCEAPVWILLHGGWTNRDASHIGYWNDWFHATRETQELRQETEQMGWSLARLAQELEWGEPDALACLLEQAIITLPAAHAYSTHALGIDQQAGLTAYLFTWLENQVMAAIKTVPLGQMAGQRILDHTRRQLPAVYEEATGRASHSPPRVYTLAPQFAILSSRHETQYSRLFRS
jgi:urease accessory protein